MPCKTTPGLWSGWRGKSSATRRATKRSSTLKRPLRPARPGAELHGHDFLLLVRQVLIDPGDVLIGQLLHFHFGVLLIVFGNLAGLGLFFQMLHGVTAHVTDSHTAIFGHLLHDF